MPDVTLDGVWLGSIGHVGDVAWGTRWGTGPCGPFEASCTLAIEPSNDTTLVRLNATMDIYADNGVKVFSGPVSEVGRGYPRTINAKGWSRLAANFDSTSLDIQLSVAGAISRGLRWTNNPFASLVLGGGVNEPLPRLDLLLDRATAMTGTRWGADVRRSCFTATDPPAPLWMLDASDLDIGIADDGLFTHVRARHVSAVAGTPLEPTAWGVETAANSAAALLYDVIEFPLHIEDLGLVSSATAQDYAVQQLSLLTKPQWLSRIAVTSKQLLTPNGVAADLQAVQAGQMVRLFNVPNRLGGVSNELDLSVVLGEVSYSAATPDELTLAPLNLAVANLADGIERRAS